MVIKESFDSSGGFELVCCLEAYALSPYSTINKKCLLSPSLLKTTYHDRHSTMVVPDLDRFVKICKKCPYHMSGNYR